MRTMERLQFSTEVSPISYWQLYNSRPRQSSLKILINLSHRFRTQRVLLLPSIDARIVLAESFSQVASVPINYQAEHFLIEPRGLLYDMLAVETTRLGIDLRRHPTLIPAIINSITRKILPWLSTNREIFSVLIKVETIGRTYLLGSGEERDTTLILTESGLDMGARTKEMVATARGLKCVGVEEGENCSICLEEIGELGASTPCN